MAVAPLLFLLASVAEATDGGGRSPAAYGEVVELKVYEPDGDKALQRARRSVEKSGGSVVVGPSAIGTDVMRIVFTLPRPKLEKVINDLRDMGKLEHLQRRFPSAAARAVAIDEELGRVNIELSTFVPEQQSTAASILKNRKSALEKARRSLKETAALALIQFSVRASTAGPAIGPNEQTKTWKKSPRAVFSALAEDERLNAVPSFADGLARILEAGGIKLVRSNARDTSANSTVEALDKEGNSSADFFIAAIAELKAFSTDASGSRHVCSGHATMAVRAKGLATAPAITIPTVIAEGRSRSEACSRAGAQAAAGLASSFDRSGDLWRRMPPRLKKEFLRQLSALRRSSLEPP